jgi:aspartate/glutamate racemase
MPACRCRCFEAWQHALMKRLGILAHSVEGAALCFRAFAQAGFDELGPHLHPDVSLDCVAMGQSMAAWDSGDYATIRSTLATSVDRLALAGATFFACPDNTAHLALEQPGADLTLPGLHIADVVADRAARDHRTRVGVLGTSYTMAGPIYPAALAARGIAEPIANAHLHYLVHPQTAVLHGKHGRGHRYSVAHQSRPSTARVKDEKQNTASEASENGTPSEGDKSARGLVRIRFAISLRRIRQVAHRNAIAFVRRLPPRVVRTHRRDLVGVVVGGARHCRDELDEELPQVVREPDPAEEQHLLAHEALPRLNVCVLNRSRRHHATGIKRAKIKHYRN